MSVATVKDRLATICTTYISGVVTAVQGGPFNLNDADLPAVCILTGEGGYGLLGQDLEATLRTYRLVLIVKPTAEGIDLEAESLCEPFFARFKACFRERPGLHTANNTDPLANVQQATLLRDTGVINVVLAGASYMGVEFTLQVEEYDDVTRGA